MNWDDKKQNLKFNAGEVVVATTGEYSDFGIEGFFVTIKPVDLKPLAQEYASLRRAANEYGEFDGFVSWLVTKELVVPVDYRGVHLGKYSDFDPDFEVPEKE